MKKGSITIYVSLILCVVLSLVYTAIDSARYSCGRAFVSLAAEEGLFSLFSEYDRLIYDKYGLLLIDGGYTGTELKSGALLEEAQKYMKRVLFQDETGRLLTFTDPFRIDIDRASVTGYVLATDSGGEMIRKQIHELMIQKIGLESVNALFAYFNESASILQTADTSDSDQMDRLKAEYEARKKAAEEEKKEAEAAGETAQEKQIPSELPDGFENPIDNIFKLKKLGILSLVVPDITAVSAETVGKAGMPSQRGVSQGFGIIPENQSGVMDSFLLAKYITDYFPCFTDKVSQGGFRYQAEYAVAGKNTDVENLKSILNRLLLIREGLNFTYLLSDPEKRAEAEAMALAITSAVLLPELAPLATVILLLCWAFGESMLDVKTLLAGGKVPLIKDEESFRLSLSQLAQLSTDSVTEDNGKGFTYKEYLCFLLMLKGGKRLLDPCLDLLEYNRRKLGNKSAFSIDTCVCSFEMQVEGCIGKHSYVLTRSFGYDV